MSIKAGNDITFFDTGKQLRRMTGKNVFNSTRFKLDVSFANHDVTAIFESTFEVFFESNDYMFEASVELRVEFAMKKILKQFRPKKHFC